MRMIIYLPQNKHRFALLLVLVLAYCACLANTSVKSDVYRQLYGKSMMQAFAVAQAYEAKGNKTKALAAYSAVACRYAADISEPDKRKCADALYHSAEIYYSDRLYSLAMNQYLEALKLSERHSYPLLTTDQRISLLQEIERVMGDTKEYCNSEFGIETLASLVGSNSRYVSAAINEGYGKNFRSFLNEYRIKEAMRRLADVEHYGGYTIKAISESVGYKSQANLRLCRTNGCICQRHPEQNISPSIRISTRCSSNMQRMRHSPTTTM